MGCGANAQCKKDLAERTRGLEQLQKEHASLQDEHRSAQNEVQALRDALRQSELNAGAATEERNAVSSKVSDLEVDVRILRSELGSAKSSQNEAQLAAERAQGEAATRGGALSELRIQSENLSKECERLRALLGNREPGDNLEVRDDAARQRQGEAGESLAERDGSQRRRRGSRGEHGKEQQPLEGERAAPRGKRRASRGERTAAESVAASQAPTQLAKQPSSGESVDEMLPPVRRGSQSSTTSVPQNHRNSGGDHDELAGHNALPSNARDLTELVAMQKVPGISGADDSDDAGKGRTGGKASSSQPNSRHISSEQEGVNGKGNDGAARHVGKGGGKHITSQNAGKGQHSDKFQALRGKDRRSSTEAPQPETAPRHTSDTRAGKNSFSSASVLASRMADEAENASQESGVDASVEIFSFDFSVFDFLQSDGLRSQQVWMNSLGMPRMDNSATAPLSLQSESGTLLPWQADNAGIAGGTHPQTSSVPRAERDSVDRRLPVKSDPPEPNWTPVGASGADSPLVSEASDQVSLADDDWVLRAV